MIFVNYLREPEEKVAMKKHAGMKKCTILWGSAQTQNSIEEEKLKMMTQRIGKPAFEENV